MANSSISYLELNHWWHYCERWQHDNRCRLEDGLAPLVQKLGELQYSFFFYAIGEPGYVVLMRLIIWKSWPTYIVIHCCKKGEYIGTPPSCFFQEVIFQILENLMATSFYIVPEKNVSCSWINYFCYHSSNYDYHKNVDVSRVIHNISITYRYLGLVSELRVIEKTIFFSFF